MPDIKNVQNYKTPKNYIRETFYYCGCCEYFDPKRDGETGLCVRYPPRLLSENGEFGGWPGVYRDDRCGEWKKILQEKDQ